MHATLFSPTLLCFGPSQCKQNTPGFKFKGLDTLEKHCISEIIIKKSKYLSNAIYCCHFNCVTVFKKI